MEKRLNDLNALVQKLTERMHKLMNKQSAEAIEIDIMLDILRQVYVSVEQLKDTKQEDKTDRKQYSAPVVQVVQEVQHKEPVQQAADIQKETIELQQEEEKEEVVHHEEPVFEPAPISIDEVPVMSFARVEVDTPEIERIITPEKSQVYTQPVAEQTQEEYRSPVPSVEPPRPVEMPKVEVHVPTIVVENKPETVPVAKAPKVSGDLFGGQTIADKLKKETPSLNDRITQGMGDRTLGHKMQLKPISDLKTAIGINEKFQFVNDLFEGRIDLYNEAINRLNICGSSLVAEGIIEDLKKSYNWSETADAYGKFINFVHRRYI